MDSYADMHTGPASEYPRFHVVEKGEWISVLKERTGWYKVATESGKSGWISARSLTRTFAEDGEQITLTQPSFEQSRQRDWEFGLYAGVLENTTALSVSAAWVVTENIVTEIAYTQALGSFSENQLASVRLHHFTFPEWRFSPYVTLGVGQIRTTPRANLVQSGSESRTNDLLEAGVGFRYYLAKNYVVRLEYQRLLALIERDEQEELESWKLGFAVFF
ncbi:SH3 domain-containing protein [Aestuariibacter salexigens]|uniref:SH3 domain-containing protein n=1 Tax=Aestuariibacter salexigens TaxID=226010 RepID=UPI00040D908C|nr:SH3 domain-containing protein [Aestuariibacter salexigens]